MLGPEEIIAELMGRLPRFIGLMLSGKEIEAAEGLNQSEFRTLIYLHRCEGQPMAGYSKQLGISKGSFTYVADNLEKKGLAERVSMVEDKRKQALFLTEKGKVLASKIDAEFTQNIKQNITCLKKSDLKKLETALRTIDHTIDLLKERKQ